MPEKKKNTPPIKRRKRRAKKSGIGYIILFAFVFLFALWGLSYLVKSYSPDVDVTIGNTPQNEPLTLTETEAEIKTIDERLKWIQMEDNLPTVSIKVTEEKIKQSSAQKKETLKTQQKEEKKQQRPEPPKPDIKKQELNIKLNTVQDNDKYTISIDKKENKQTKVSKVYVGQYSNLEDAIKMQNKIASQVADTTPFVKSINGKYVIQLGSFTEKEKAMALVSRMNSLGFNARVVSER